MSLIELGFLLLTLIIVGLGALFGFLRGRNRSILCIGLTVFCVICAFCLRGVFTSIVLNFKIALEGTAEKITIEPLLTETISDALADAIGSDMAGTTTNQIMSQIVMPTIKSLLNLIGFVLFFCLLKLITFIAYFPLKKVVKEEEKKQIAVGIPVGVAQALIVAFCICGPFAGLLAHSGRLITTAENVVTSLPSDLIDMDENPFEMIPQKDNVVKFEKSYIGKFYVPCFRGPFNAIASSGGYKLADTLDAINSLGQIAGSVTTVVADLDLETLDISNPSSLNDIKTIFAKIDEINEQTPEGAKEAINTVITIAIDSVPIADMTGDVEIANDIKEALKEIDYTDIKLMNEFEMIEQVQKIANYEQEITKEDAVSIVKSFSKSKLAPRVLKKLKKADVDIDPDVKAEIKDAIKDMTFDTDKEQQVVEDLKRILDL